MPKGGLRAIALGALLLTVGLAPFTASQQTCAGAGPAEVCVDDPLEHDAGEIAVLDGEVSAEANGGIATGVGSTTFVVDYEVETDDVGPEEELVVTGRLLVRDSDHRIVGFESFVERLASGEDAQDELRVEVGTVAPLVEGGSVTVTARAEVQDTNSFEYERLGQAQSASPITVLVAPPEDVADRTTVGQTVDVGSFEAGPASGQAEVLDAELIVASDTAVKLVATGELSSSGTFPNVDNLRQESYARLWVYLDGTLVETAFVEPIRERCSTSCSGDARTVPVELSVVIPGDVEDTRRDLSLRVQADWHAQWTEGGVFNFDTNGDTELGANELVAAGP